MSRVVVAAPMAIFMPAIAEGVGLALVVAGAWLGGTIDTSGAVVASGEILGDSALNAAVIVKFSQNALLGLAAFAISLWWAFRGTGEREGRPTAAMIWDRFPKFVHGFIVVSLLFSFLLSADVVDATGGLLKGIRTWWFSLAFLCIGLETRFRDLVSMDGGRPAAGFWLPRESTFSGRSEWPGRSSEESCSRCRISEGQRVSTLSHAPDSRDRAMPA